MATSTGLLLSQQKYVIDLLRKHNMFDSKPVSTPLVVDTSLTATDGSAPINVTMYRQVVGDLQHLQMIRLDISFAVNKLSRFMHSPSKHHRGAVKRLLHYLNGTRSLGIQLLADTPLTLHGVSNADWAGNSNDHISTEAFLIFLGANPIFCCSTNQCSIVRSSIEAKYRAIVAVIAKFQ